MNSYKIAIIGSHDAIGGFRAIGVDAISVTTCDECRNVFVETIRSNKYAIIFITEDWAEKISDLVSTHGSEALPSIVAIPAQSGSVGVGLNNLRKIVERAVGSDILKD